MGDDSPEYGFTCIFPAQWKLSDMTCRGHFRHGSIRFQVVHARISTAGFPPHILLIEYSAIRLTVNSFDAVTVTRG